MSQAIDIKVPDIGDFTDVPVIEVFVKVRHPDLGGSLFGTSNQRVDHFRAGLGMAEGLFG
jgi:hypothetical protein